MTVEAETAVTQLHAVGRQGRPTRQTPAEAGRVLPHVSEGAADTSIRTFSSRAARHVSVVSSHRVCGT